MNPKRAKFHTKDLFPNHAMLKFVNCPVFMIHGTKDQVIAFDVAKKLSQCINNPYKLWWIEDSKHMSIRKKAGIKYGNELYAFLDHIHQTKLNHTSRSLQKINQARKMQL